MKKINTVLFILLILNGISCNHKSIDSNTPDISMNPISVKCYHLWNAHDSVSLTVQYKGDSINGTLVYNLFQKDKNTGEIHGKVVDDDLLIANYTFLSEGMQSLRQVAFKKIGGNLIEGYGETEDKNGVSYFRNIDSLKFNDSFILKLDSCQPKK